MYFTTHRCLAYEFFYVNIYYMQNNRSGIPMDEKSLKEWQQAFQDIEDSIKGIYEEEKPKRSKKSDALAETNSARKSKAKNKK